MSDNRIKNAIEQIARRDVPENTNLWSRIEARIEKRTSPMNTLRRRPLVAILLAIIFLLIASGVAYAISRSLGFSPALGVVDTSSLRMLDQPVAVERDGFRVTVTEAAVDDLNTVIRYQVERLTPSSQDGEYDTSCQGTPTLLTQDGTKIGEGVGAADGKGITENGYWLRMEFPMLPIGLNDVKFVVPCLQPLVTGTLPQNWEFDLHFVPWDRTPLAPVYEIPPATETPVPIIATEIVTEQATLPVRVYGITFALEQVTELDSGYIFEGSANWKDPKIQPYSVSPYSAHLMDTTGRVIPLDWASPQIRPVSESQNRWAFQSAEKPSALPLTLVLDGYTFTLMTDATFDLDLGTSPQRGQTWNINTDVTVEDHILHIDSATWLYDTSGNRLEFQLSSDDRIDGAGLFDLQNTAGAGGGGGGLGEPEKGPFITNVYYQNEIPPGVIHISITSLDIVVREPWQTTWQP